MSDFLNFMKAKAEVEAARNLYDFAATKLELEQIKCRLAEIKSQADPLNNLLKNPITTREQLYSVAFYVVMGRWPEEIDRN